MSDLSNKFTKKQEDLLGKLICDIIADRRNFITYKEFDNIQEMQKMSMGYADQSLKTGLTVTVFGRKLKLVKDIPGVWGDFHNEKEYVET